MSCPSYQYDGTGHRILCPTTESHLFRFCEFPGNEFSDSEAENSPAYSQEELGGNYTDRVKRVIGLHISHLTPEEKKISFQRLMDTVLKEMNGTELFVYLDDIVFYSENLEEHDKKARRLIARLRDVNFKLQLDKYDFLRTEVAFLGHVIGRDGVKPNPAMINAIKKFPNPTIVRAIQQFLGLSGCNRRFIHDYVELAKPLSDLLKKDVKLEWGCNCRRSF